MADDNNSTRDRILDAAEELFAHRGFDGVSVRQIMSKAEADVSLAYYHFKSKRDLFEQVMLRRAEILNDIRLKALEVVEEHHPDDAPSVEEIIGAFVNPLIELLAREHDEWSHYFQLIDSWKPCARPCRSAMRWTCSGVITSCPARSR